MKRIYVPSRLIVLPTRATTPASSPVAEPPAGLSRRSLIQRGTGILLLSSLPLSFGTGCPENVDAEAILKAINTLKTIISIVEKVAGKVIATNGSKKPQAIEIIVTLLKEISAATGSQSRKSEPVEEITLQTDLLPTTGSMVNEIDYGNLTARVTGTHFTMADSLGQSVESQNFQVTQ